MRRGLHGIKEINRSQSVIIGFFSWGSDRPTIRQGRMSKLFTIIITLISKTERLPAP